MTLADSGKVAPNAEFDFSEVYPDTPILRGVDELRRGPARQVEHGAGAETQGQGEQDEGRDGPYHQRRQPRK